MRLKFLWRIFTTLVLSKTFDKWVRKVKGTWEGKLKQGYLRVIRGSAWPDTVPAHSFNK